MLSILRGALNRIWAFLSVISMTAPCPVVAVPSRAKSPVIARRLRADRCDQVDAIVELDAQARGERRIENHSDLCRAACPGDHWIVVHDFDRARDRRPSR